MTPDEHERRLRDAVIQHWHSPTCQNTHTIMNRGATIHCQERAQLLQVYADWLRLRAVADAGCMKNWAQLGRCRAGHALTETKGYCRGCAAQQQIAAILAAAGGADAD